MFPQLKQVYYDDSTTASGIQFNLVMEATHLSHTKLSCIQTSWINISSMVFQGNGVTLHTCVVSAVRGPVAATFIELSPTPGRLAEVEEDTNWSQDFH